MMIIEAINLNGISAKKSQKKFDSKKSAGADLTNNYNYLQNSEQKVDALSASNYFDINFKGREENKRFSEMKKDFAPKTEKILVYATRIAKRLNSPVVTQDHMYLAILVDLDKYIDELNNGAKYEETLSNVGSVPVLEEYIAPAYFKEKEGRAKIQPVIKDEINNVKKSITQQAQNNPRVRRFGTPPLSPSLINDIYFLNKKLDATTPSQSSTSLIDDSVLLASLLSSESKSTRSKTLSFVNRLQEAAMIDEAPQKEKIHLHFYDEKADNLWKNFDLGRNMFVLFDKDNENAPKYLLRSFANLINKPGQTYKNLNKDNVDITFFNDKANFELITKKYEDAKKDKDKKHIFVLDWATAGSSSSRLRGMEGQIIFTLEDLKLIQNKDKESNVQFLILSNKDFYYGTNQNALIKSSVDDYGELSLPIMNAEDTKKVLIESPEFIDKAVKKKVSEDAITFAVEVSSADDGIYPEKTLKLLKNVASYFVEKDEITSEDIATYIDETKHLSKTTDSDEPFKVVFNTGKTLDDIVGSPMTKAEAESIVNQIKNQRIGTKGMTFFLDTGSSYGGGRRHTAEAIAGEAGIPMITINARDFAMKDIDAMSQNAGLSEIKIRKIINSARTQAEANPNKTAMIFIEHFDNFASNPLYGISSIYEQKAFSQLLEEMENIRKNEDLNIVVVGSTDMPELLDENIMKPHKFLDQVIIYSPRDVKDREDLIKYYAEKNNFKIAGDTEEEKNSIIKSAAETTSGFTVVDILYMLDKADIIAKERDHDAIDKSDFTEAFLQTTSGRVSSVKDSAHRKELVTKHEGGHALTLQFMYDLAKEQERPWHVPDKVNFITLDPRGDYGGATYPKDSENDEYSFEKLFSNLICYFGGHSAEKRFFNMDGSWGITGDMQQATNTAKMAVQYMGLGPNTGKIAIYPSRNGTLDISEKMRDKIDSDVDVLLKNANTISDMIVNTYDGFLEEFGQKYKDRVGTGDCIVTSDEFQKELYDWVEKQPESKKKEIEKLKQDVLMVIDKTKKGIVIDKDTIREEKKHYAQNEHPPVKGGLPPVDE